MATYSITTTPKMDKVMTKVLAKVNKNLTANKKPVLTIAQLIQQLMNDNLDGYSKQHDDDETVTIFNAYSTSSDATRASIRASLGLA